MKKNKKSELKNSDDVLKIAEKSKTITKKLSKVEVNGKDATLAKLKPKKLEDSLEKQKEIGPKDLAKIEKKKAKKLAQKLKKKLKKAETAVVEKAPENELDIQKLEKKKNDLNVQKLKKKQKKTETAVVEKTPENELDLINDTKETLKDKQPLKVEDDAKKLEKKQLKVTKKEKIKENNKVQRQQDPTIDAATVFVGNLPTNTKRVQLMRLFADYGPVQTIRFRTAGGKIIFKHKDRLQAGALNAYILLADKSSAQRALALNGSEFKGNHLRVTRADSNSHNRGESDAKRMIFIGNLKYSATEENLREIFSSCGEIEYVRCLREGEKGCKGVAYLCFKAPEAVGLALELNETMLDERPIHVERYSAKKLGAKKVRDAAAEIDKKSSTGAKKRLDNKKVKLKNDDKKISKHQPTSGQKDDSNKKKKAEFRGIKVDGIKKKPKKNKKVTSQMEQLAKKIAPKTAS